MYTIGTHMANKIINKILNFYLKTTLAVLRIKKFILEKQNKKFKMRSVKKKKKKNFPDFLRVSWKPNIATHTHTQIKFNPKISPQTPSQ